MGDTTSGAATAIMFAVAAVLWFVYLIPTWLRRREYLATERNVTRLQQSLRIMVEAAEVPQEVHAEASARGVAQQQRLQRERERQRAALEQAMLAKARAERAAAELAAQRVIRQERMRVEALRLATDPADPTDPSRAEPVALLDTATRVVADARRRRRRARLATSTVLLASLTVVVVQTVLVLLTGAVTASWLVLGGAAVGAALAAGTLRSLARSPLRRATDARRAQSAPVAVPDFELAGPLPTRGWTPVPVPAPLYAGTPQQQPVAPSRDAERLARDADEAVRRAVSAARRESAVVEFQVAPARTADEAPVPRGARTEVAAAAAAPGDWSRMGRIDTAAPASAPNLDEVLRRRRAG